MDPVFFWRGFRHEWLREVMGFRLPHRISRLHSYLSEAVDDPRFHFAQSTGVDGNYMKPVGRWGALVSPGVTTQRATAAFQWRDAIDPLPVPIARSRQSKTLRIPTGGVPTEVLLAGIRLDTKCCDEHQSPDNPCNSNGLWPCHLAVRLEPPVRDGDHHVFEVVVEIDRAWTPTRGGVPFVEEKPLNEKLDFDLEVFVTALSGDDQHLRTKRQESRAVGSARRRAPRTTGLELQGTPNTRLGTVGLTGFGFTFVQSGRTRFHEHRGRYLTTLDFGVDALRYDPLRGRARVSDPQSVWIPRTVIGTDVETELHSVLVQLPHREARTWTGEAVGSLCAHSSDQAPFFSRWKKTGARVGPVRTEDSVPVSPFSPPLS